MDSAPGVPGAPGGSGQMSRDMACRNDGAPCGFAARDPVGVVHGTRGNTGVFWATPRPTDASSPVRDGRLTGMSPVPDTRHPSQTRNSFRSPRVLSPIGDAIGFLGLVFRVSRMRRCPISGEFGERERNGTDLAWPATAQVAVFGVTSAACANLLPMRGETAGFVSHSFAAERRYSIPRVGIIARGSESLERTMTGRVLKVSRTCLRFSATLTIPLMVVLQLHGCARLPHYESRSEPASQKETGIASYYSKKFHRRKTASGEPLDNHALTAAHKTLPLGSRVVVRNVNNGKSVTVRITDRGPYVKGRIIDLTQGAFSRIASLDKGVAKVEIRLVN